MKTVAKDGKLYAEVTLRDVLERTEDLSGLPMLSEIKRLYDENEKLRELVRHSLTFCANGYCSEDDGCMWTTGKFSCSFADRAKRLGVEADDD